MIYSNPVNIEIAMRWERAGGMQVSLDVDEESGVKKYAWEYGKESDGRSYLVIEGDAGKVFISEKLCKMISTFLECKGKHDMLSGQLQEHQQIADMFSVSKAASAGDQAKPAADPPKKTDSKA